MSIETLDGLTTGRYVVTTYNGTRHYIDLDNMTAVRVAKGFDHKSTEFQGETLVPGRTASLSGSNKGRGPSIAGHARRQGHTL